MFPTEAVPERIGAYKVLRRMAGVGSADVYVGRMEGPRGFSRLCTLKLVPSTIEGDERFAAELEREAAICATLNHPAIQRMFDFFEHEKHLVLVLEHIEGTTLERLLAHLSRRQKKLSDAAIATLGRDLASAIAHAHALKDEDRKPTPVIHRNITPENVLIGWDGEVRLTGFGLGKILGRTPDTVIGIVKGARGFMAPEQSRGERVTPKADVYALGLLLWTLFSGQKPPDDGKREAPLVMLRSDLPKPLALAIDQALEPAPDKRTITCQDLEAQLAKFPGIDKGREEIAEKALLLRSAKAPSTESEVRPKVVAGPARSATPRPQRRVPLSQVRPGKPPASSKEKLSVPPPPSRPSQSNMPAAKGERPSQRPSQRPTPPGHILSEEGPESVFPILRKLAEHVPKPGAAIPGPPRAPTPRPLAKPPTPPPGPARPVAPVPMGAGLMPKGEWKESVPDEEALDRFFDEATTTRDQHDLRDLDEISFEEEPQKPDAEAEAKAKASAEAETGLRAKKRIELEDTIPGTTPVFDEPHPATQTQADKPAARQTPPPPMPAVGKPPAVPTTPITTPTPQPVRFGAAPQPAMAATPAPPIATPAPPIAATPAPPKAVRFGPPPGAAPPAQPPQNLRSTTQIAPRPYGAKAKGLKPTAASLAVVGGIACMVTAAIVMIVGRPSTEQPTPSPSAAAPTAAPEPTPTAAQPAATQAPKTQALPPPTAGLGYLTVDFPREGLVYVSGRKMGKTNEPLLVPCGSKFVRISTTAEGRYPDWLSDGQTISIACLGSTKIPIALKNGR